MSKLSFTTPQTDPIVFDVDGEEFRLVAAPPAESLMLMGRLDGENEAATLLAVTEFFELVLDDDSFARFTDRLRGYRLIPDPGVTPLPQAAAALLADMREADLTRRPVNPDLAAAVAAALDAQPLRERVPAITFPTAMEVFSKLVEETADRPTELPSGSPTGQPPTGPSSTVPAPSGG